MQEDDQSPIITQTDMELFNNEQFAHMPQIVIPFENYELLEKAFKQIENAALDLQYAVIQDENARLYKESTSKRRQLMLIQKERIPLGRKLTSYICRDQSNMSQSKYCIIVIKYVYGQIKIKALSGAIQITQDHIQILANSLQINQEKREQIKEFHDDVDLNPYQIEQLAQNMIYRYLYQEQNNRINQKLLIIKTEPQVKKQLQEIYKLVTATHQGIINDNNHLSKRQNQSLFPFYKIAIERYIFSQMYQQLFAFYKQKYQEQDLAVWNKKQEIIKRMTQVEMFNFLELKKVYQSPNLYKNSIKIFNQFTFVNIPQQQIQTLQNMMSYARSEAIDFNKQYELFSMDDELPIIIYLTVYTSIEDLYARVMLLEDYVRNDPSLESERRIITNIKVSLDYINKEWN
ncbi:hypothetical protein pb186bvf_020075 [Paramecium bursaria]